MKVTTVNNPLRILYIARNFPFPPNRGERIRDYYFLRYLAEKHSVTLAARLYNEHDRQNVEQAKEFCDRIITRYIPKTKNIIEAFYRISRPLLSGAPLITGTMCFPQLGRAIYKELIIRDYDVVQIEHTPLSYYLRFIPSNYSGIKVIDLHNIETLRLERLLNITNNKLNKAFLAIDIRRIRAYETFKLKEYDHIFTVSDLEKTIIKKWLPDKPVTTLPNQIDSLGIDERKEINNAGRGNELLFVGSMKYAANEDAMIWFIKDILPLLKKRIPDIHLTIVGHDPSARLKTLASNYVEITGTVSSVKPYYKKAAIVIVPLRAGGGSRLKILEAMNYGVPVISTSIGAEGLDVRPGIDIFVADDPITIVEAIYDLLKNPYKRNSIAASAQQRVRSIYDWRVIGEALCHALQQTVFEKTTKRCSQ